MCVFGSFVCAAAVAPAAKRGIKYTFENTLFVTVFMFKYPYRFESVLLQADKADFNEKI